MPVPWLGGGILFGLRWQDLEGFKACQRESECGREAWVHLRLVFTRSLCLYESRVERYHVVTYIHVIQTHPSDESDIVAGHWERDCCVRFFVFLCWIVFVMEDNNTIQIGLCDKSQQIIKDIRN